MNAKAIFRCCRFSKTAQAQRAFQEELRIVRVGGESRPLNIFQTFSQNEALQAHCFWNGELQETHQAQGRKDIVLPQSL